MRVLLTGAAGGIGAALRRGLAGRYALLRLADIAPQESAGAGEECVAADVRDLVTMETACAGIDCVVHLAGVSVEPEQQAWEQVLPTNIVGTYNVFEAARRAGCPRIVFASSNHVVGFFRRTRSVGVDEPIRPDSYYGLSKCFGEALGRLYADKHAMSVACLRIGSFREQPEDRRQLATWISHRDCIQLVRRCIEAKDYHFLIAYGISRNSTAYWHDDSAAALGYEPQDSADHYVAAIQSKCPREDELSAQFHGGSYCGMGFTGDPRRVD